MLTTVLEPFPISLLPAPRQGSLFSAEGRFTGIIAGIGQRGLETLCQ